MANAIDPPVRAEDVNLASDYTFTTKEITAIYVGTGGTIIATMFGDGGTYHTYKNVQSGSYLLGRFKTVRSTGNGTTASDLVGVTGIPNEG